MTWEQYWDGDCCLVKYYREADRIRQERQNQVLWLQGMYVYEALCDASPLFRYPAKKGTKAIPYSKEPYALGARRKETEEEQQKIVYEKGMAKMKAFMAAMNEKFDKPLDDGVQDRR